ncbi:MAG: hypothetical protein GX495_02375 [Chloroflexi bacterium]|jgi:hypothetical protein|nr:hypothetical protein [Chloroflexota bacterium]
MFSRYAFVVLAALFVICVLVQIFLAGMAIFSHAVYWSWHRAFIHFFELIPLLMLLFGWIGRVPVRLRWQTLGLFGMILLQYLTANIRGLLPAAAAVHPVTAVFIAGLGFSLLSRSWKFIRTQQAAAPAA